MKRLAIMLIVMLLGAAPAAQHSRVEPLPLAPATQMVRFTYLNIHIDPKGQPLAAYQVEFVADPQKVKLVGVEGGSDLAFKDPPYYDPAALSHNRVIVAAFNTGDELPSKPFRAASLHVEIVGSAKPQWSVKLMTAATPDGKSIPAVVSVEGVNP